MAIRPWLEDEGVRLYHGDVLDVLGQLPAGVAQTVVTSPPYWGLRDYGTGEWTGGDADCQHTRHIDYGKKSDTNSGAIRGGPMGATCDYCGAQRVDSQLGLEATPELYVERLIAVFREVWRVLRDDGTVWLNLGDSYATGAGAVGDHPGGGAQGASWKGARTQPNRMPLPGLKPKDLVGIPWRVALALQADGWYLRMDVVWSKPNPMPESVTDRPTKAHEYLFLLAKRERYFYDADAIREPLAYDSAARAGRGSRYDDPDVRQSVPYSAPRPRVRSGNKERKHGEDVGAADAHPGDLGRSIPWEDQGAGRNKRSVWTIATEPVADAHFATFPRGLVRPCVLAGSSERGECSACGSPWRRVVEPRPASPQFAPLAITKGNALPDGPGTHRNMGGRYQKWLEANPARTAGWEPTCGCHVMTTMDDFGTVLPMPPDTRPQTILDPFAGSGTVALVARQLGRRSIGIDLNDDYLRIAARRLASPQLADVVPVDEVVQLSLLGGAPDG